MCTAEPCAPIKNSDATQARERRIVMQANKRAGQGVEPRAHLQTPLRDKGGTHVGTDTSGAQLYGIGQRQDKGGQQRQAKTSRGIAARPTFIKMLSEEGREGEGAATQRRE